MGCFQHLYMRRYHFADAEGRAPRGTPFASSYAVLLEVGSNRLLRVVRGAMAKAESQSPVNGAGVGETWFPRPEDLGYRKGKRSVKSQVPLEVPALIGPLTRLSRRL